MRQTVLAMLLMALLLVSVPAAMAQDQNTVTFITITNHTDHHVNFNISGASSITGQVPARGDMTVKTTALAVKDTKTTYTYTILLEYSSREGATCELTVENMFSSAYEGPIITDIKNVLRSNNVRWWEVQTPPAEAEDGARVQIILYDRNE